MIRILIRKMVTWSHNNNNNNLDGEDLKDDDQKFDQKDGDLAPNVGDPSARHKCQEDSVGHHVSQPEVNMGPEKLWLITWV